MILVKYDLSEMLGKMTRTELTEMGLEIVSQIKNAVPSEESVIFLPDFVTISKAPLKYLIQYRDALNKMIEQNGAEEEESNDISKYFD